MAALQWKQELLSEECSQFHVPSTHSSAKWGSCASSSEFGGAPWCPPLYPLWAARGLRPWMGFNVGL